MLSEEVASMQFSHFKERANISKKFQLLRHLGLGPFDFAPEVQDVAILLIGNAQNTCIS